MEENITQQPERPLEQGPPPDELLAEEQKQMGDCLPCRLMGATAFTGLGVYSYVSGHYQLRQQRQAILASKSLIGMRTRQTSITGLAAVLVGAGLYRLVN